jgi:hypothetical protein
LGGLTFPSSALPKKGVAHCFEQTRFKITVTTVTPLTLTVLLGHQAAEIVLFCLPAIALFAVIAG